MNKDLNGEALDIRLRNVVLVAVFIVILMASIFAIWDKKISLKEEKDFCLSTGREIYKASLRNGVYCQNKDSSEYLKVVRYKDEIGFHYSSFVKSVRRRDIPNSSMGVLE